MKNVHLVLVLCCFFGLQLKAQDFTASKNTFLTISLTVNDGLVDKLDEYEPTTDREKKVIDRNLDSLDARLTRYALSQLYKSLAERKNIQLEKISALRDWINYGRDNLPSVLIPKTTIKKLGNKGYKTDYFFKFSISITAGGSILGGLKPNVSCDIRVFDADREVIKDASARYKHETNIRAWDFPANTFDKLGLEYVEALQIQLEEMVRRAIIRTVDQM